MTTKKKLLALGAVTAILLAALVFIPDGLKGKLLSSRMISDITDPTIDHQILFSKIFGTGVANRDNFYQPRDIAVYENKLFITDWYNNRVKVIDKNTGATIKVIGKATSPYHSSALGEFNQPFGIAIDAENKFFYVTDAENNRVQKFKLDDYSFVQAFGTQGTGTGNFLRPRGIALDVKNDRLYVTDSWNCRVERFTLSTLEYRDTWGTCGTGPQQFARHNSSWYYSGPEGIVVDQNGIIYISDSYNNRIKRYNYKGSELGTIATTGTTTASVHIPMGLTIDQSGYLYVADAWDHRIQKFDIRTTGSPLVRVFGSQGSDNGKFAYPRGISVDADGTIYVADTNNHRIQVFKQHIITPTAPTNLVAKPDITQVDLTWTAATTRAGGSDILDYIIEYKKSSDTQWNIFNDGVSTLTHTTVTGLTGVATEYNFRISAENKAREKSDTSTLVTTKLLTGIAPSAPGDLVALSGNGQITLQWSASATRGGPAIRDYKIQYRIRQAHPASWTTFAEGVVSTNTTAQVTALTNDIQYEFQVTAQNTSLKWSVPSALITKTPSSDDKCNNILGVQQEVPVNTKRTSGDCICINEGVLDKTVTPPTCTLTCPTRSIVTKPEFKVEYDEGFPKIYTNATDTIGTAYGAKRLILSAGKDGTIFDTGTFEPLFRPNGQPFYDPDILTAKPQLSLQRSGNTLKVLLYGNRTDTKIEHVRGKITLQGSPDIHWTSISDISMDTGGKGVNSVGNDYATIMDNTKVLRFDLAVNEGNDVFVARYDIGGDGCIERPLIVFNKNNTNATGTMADQNIIVGKASVLAPNSFVNPGYSFTGWATTPTGPVVYTNGANYTMIVASNVHLYAVWNPKTYTVTANATAGGTITPATKTVAHGDTMTFTLNSDNGYNTTSVTGCAGTLTGNTYKTGTITSDCVVNATFSKKTYTITANAKTGGTITPATKTVNHGSTTNFTLNPDSGHEIGSVTGCSGTLTGLTYTTGSVTANCTVNATFTLKTDPAKCTGTRPTDSTIKMDIGTSTVSSPWKHDSSPTGPYQLCTFQCNSGTTYNATNNTCETIYTVIFNSQNATTPAQPRTKKVTTPDTTIDSLPVAPVKTGYTFGGWYTAVNGGGTQFTKTTPVTADITVYAKWTVTPDTTAPSVTAFNIPKTSTSLTVPITTLTASEAGVSYMIFEAASADLVPARPDATSPNWETTAPTNYVFGTAGLKRLYVWVKDDAGNVSTEYVSDTVTITLSDTTAPTVTAFAFPATSTSLTVPITTFTASEEGVEYLITYSSTQPLATATGWSTTKPTRHTFLTAGVKTLYAWVKDAADNVSTSLSDSVTITLPDTKPAAPLAPIVPEQTNISLSSTQTGTFVATGNTVVVKVACAAGKKVNIYNSIAFTPLQTVNCVKNLATFTLNLGSQESYRKYAATIVDTAGNESDYSPYITIFKKVTTNDAPGIPDLDAIFDLGSSSTDNLTSETLPRFTLTCTSGSTVNLFDSTNLIGTGPCVANTAQIIPLQPLSAGVHMLTAKQSTSAGITSAASGVLTLTVDTTPLNVTLARAPEQSEPATTSTIKFTATFDRSIDTNSFICSDVTVVNGTCTSVTLLSGNVYLITVTATAQGQVKVILYPGRIQTDAGNLNTEGTGVNTVTYGTVSATAECSTLRSFTTTHPTSSSLDGEKLCNSGNAGSVIYSSSSYKWTYQCRSTTDGTTVPCAVTASLGSGPTCDRKSVDEPRFDECSLTKTSNMFYFYKYLDCLGIAEKSSCTSSGCTQEAKRQELIYLGDRLRGIPLDDNYDCQGSHTDTERGVASWVCEAAEKAQIAGLISATNTKFRPLDTMTRVEAYSVLMKSICVHPETTYKNWQTEVAKAAKEYGFTSRTISNFEPNRPILRQELYALTARLAEYSSENPDTCDALPDELICK